MTTPIVPVPPNPHKAPEAQVADHEGVGEELFYVVAPSKFLIMMVGTLGIYAVYWFYKNWSIIARRRKESLWPVARGIFAVFFTHALFKEVDGELQVQGKLKSFAWQPSTLASIYVASAIGSSLCGRLSGKGIGSPVTDLVALALFVPTVYALYSAQFAFNLASGDPQGTGNRSLTAANIAWLVPGAILWLLTIVGMFLILTGRAQG